MCSSLKLNQMENPADDPREFAHADPGDFDMHNLPPGLDAFLMALQGRSERNHPPRSRSRPESETSGSRVTFSVLGDNGPRIISFGGPNTLGRRSSPGGEGRVPTMSEYLRRDTPTSPTIAGPLMAQYLMAMLGHNDPISELLSRRLGGDITGTQDGRLGDYVFNQEALDQIITQLMESSNANRPVPASEEVVNNLQRDILLDGSDTLEKDCAVCKEQFSLNTDNPDELMVVTLPCKHIFHEPCITPWLKSSGTCPVCRYALVPQPGQPSTSAAQSGPNVHPTGAHLHMHARSGSPDSGSHSAGFLHTLLGGFGRGGDGSHRRSNSDPSRSTRHGASHFPGSWEEGLD
ncbi:hypothetical protein AX17_000403 [Amanita inopinata Kibby_2008]|nr:hypothetical protein AX17_000403 [Amanita inopinata Kibby_2008]